MARLVFANRYHNVPDPGTGTQARFDFTGFDTKATNLHLQVIAPQIHQIAVGSPAGQITAAVELAIAEWVRDEFFRAQLRQIQVAFRNARTADIELAGHTHGQRLLARVQYIGLSVGNRSTNRNSALAKGSDLKRGGERGGFGRAIPIQQMLGFAELEYPANHLRVKHVAADDQVAQLAEHRHQRIGVLMK